MGIKEIIRQKIAGWLEVDSSKIVVGRPTEFRYGDYSINLAFTVKKEDKDNKEGLEKLKDKIVEDIQLAEIIDRVEIVGWYINIWLKREILINTAEEINYPERWREKIREGQIKRTMVIDYSAPNIAKPFGIGHLRSTNIGQAIYNLYSFLGWNCIGDNHLGDWGTQFGKLITAIKLAKQEDKEWTISDLEKLYVDFHKMAEKRPELEDEARRWFVKLENKDPEARRIWEKCVAISMKEFNRVYELLEVKIDNAYRESSYEDNLKGVIEELKTKKIAKKSQGAWVVELKDMPVGMIEKSDGTTTYLTRDLATIKFRVEKWRPEMMVYEVGADHKLHFRQLFRIAGMMGWFPENKFVHIAHGMIRWKDGKFSTRKGTTIHLTEVIDEAKRRAKEITENRLVKKKMSDREMEEMINAVAVGAIKYSDLAANPTRDIIFNWDRVMSLEGNSGPYLQYTYARCASVIERSKIKEVKNIDIEEEEGSRFATIEEKELLREFFYFEEKLNEAAERFNPSVLVEYLIKIARLYNDFYAKRKIIDEKEEVERLFLTKTTMSILEIGLTILGIKTIKRM